MILTAISWVASSASWTVPRNLSAVEHTRPLVEASSSSSAWLSPAMALSAGRTWVGREFQIACPPFVRKERSRIPRALTDGHAGSVTEDVEKQGERAGKPEGSAVGQPAYLERLSYRRLKHIAQTYGRQPCRVPICACSRWGFKPRVADALVRSAAPFRLSRRRSAGVFFLWLSVGSPRPAVSGILLWARTPHRSARSSGRSRMSIPANRTPLGTRKHRDALDTIHPPSTPPASRDDAPDILQLTRTRRVHGAATST